MYSRKGFRPGKKAQLSGFKDPLSITYISFLMCIPGVSENKAIGLAKMYPTMKSLMDMFLNEKVPEKEKLAQMRDIEVSHSMGDKNKKLGKVLADRIFKVLMSANPNI
jgi:crossover junction endonuclease EME1